MSDIMEKDLVLALNEYCFVLDSTKGQISCWVGPCKTTTSQSDAVVVFNEQTKRFEKVNTFREAIKTNIIAPENWYVILKNPTEGGRYPTKGSANTSPEDIQIGKKVNIVGPISFALYPGQMAKVVQGHRLRSNQYLLARVYDADSLNEDRKLFPVDENIGEKKKVEYTTGQLLIIKGTEQQFYIPPTGIEVIPIGGNGDKYVRDAVSLERLEYCILRDEDGNKRYVHGPDVVFPKSTEVFIEAPTGGYKFKAVELSEISGLYIKVIADYTGDDGKEYKTGEELFITGKDQKIYYPRPEHVVIKYGEKEVHHAIAIPKGEGRYVMNRLTGEIRMEKGPSMFLPDPRFEVIVKRTLTKKQCEMWYPGNNEVLGVNGHLTECFEPITPSNTVSSTSYKMTKCACDTLSIASTLARGTEYTKPRMITIDNKYDGVVTIDVWTGFAINVIGKDGSRSVVTGPNTYLMAYDETLETLELSTGNPKTDKFLHKDVFLRVSNNKVSDTIEVETKDFVKLNIKVSYCLDFLEDYKDKWFSVENYVKFVCDKMQSLMKGIARNCDISEFRSNYVQITKDAILGTKDKNGKIGRLFEENGMFINDVEVLSLQIIDSNIANIIYAAEEDRVRDAFTLENKRIKVEEEKKNSILEKELAEIKDKARKEAAERDASFKIKEENLKYEIEMLRQVTENSRLEHEQSLQELKDAIQEAELARAKNEHDVAYAADVDKNNLDKQQKENHAAMIERIMKSISPDLVAAMNNKSNADMVTEVVKSISPYTLASNGETVADVTSRLLRGTVLEDVLEVMANKE